MIDIRKKKQDTVSIANMKKGETFIYDGKLYLVIEEETRRKYLNLETSRVETGLHEYRSVPKVNCSLDYEIPF
jgi:hypothetical protein